MIEELLKRLEPFAQGCFSGNISEWPQLKPLLYDCYMFLKLLNEINENTPKKAVWKPIKTLEERKYVLVFSPYLKQEEYPIPGQFESGVMVAAYTQDRGFVDCYGSHVAWNYTHWMPIPEPPKNYK